MSSFTKFPEKGTAYLLTGPQAIFYYTGFYTDARRPKQIGPCAAYICDGKVTLAAPSNWTIQVTEMVHDPDLELIFYPAGVPNFNSCVIDLIKSSGVSDVYIEWDSISLALYKKLCELFPTFTLTDIASSLELSRFKKTDAEVSALRKAAKLAVVGMERAKEVLRAGISENQVVAELEYIMRKNGSEGVPFSMKVLSGEKSAHTTFMPGEKIIEEGDLVLLDFGARWGNYASDWTRTFCIGKASDAQHELYNKVFEIERSCIEMIKPGVTMRELMYHALDMVAGTKYEKYFLPHLGHSVGINSHESPVMDPAIDPCHVLEENTLITIEPGIYIPGFGGVRIEDDILVTADGHEILTGLGEEGLELL